MVSSQLEMNSSLMCVCLVFCYNILMPVVQTSGIDILKEYLIQKSVLYDLKLFFAISYLPGFVLVGII